MDDLHLEITEGQVFGILGPNGTAARAAHPGALFRTVYDALTGEHITAIRVRAYSRHPKRIGAIPGRACLLSLPERCRQPENYSRYQGH
ncbi:MAG: hypothetical protein U5L09_05870 [Bacteroidales bacterium]|nr:hypothetical protein [Bacteroidales bacterium]